MRKKEMERDGAFAMEVFRRAPWATLSMVGKDGRPYGVPVHVVVDGERGCLYLHCAGAGEKWEILSGGAPVCLSACSAMAVVPNAFETAYRSAVLRGRAEEITDPADRVRAMELLVRHLDGAAMDLLPPVMERVFAATRMVRILPETITGKESSGGADSAFLQQVFGK